MDITIPNLGDIDEVEVIELCVAVGDSVDAEDAVIVIESDKASMEIPAPAAGVIETFKVAIGDQVREGDVIAVLAAAQGEAPVAAPPEVEAPEPEPEAAPAAPVEAQPAGTQTSEVEVLVPDIGDATGVIVIEIAIKEGDEVAVDDLLVVLESDKASMEIAAEQAGRITKVAVSVDQEVEQGTHIATLLVEGGASPEPAAGTSNIEPAPPAPEQTPAPEPTPAPAATAPTAQTDAEPTVPKGAKVYAGPAVRRLARELGVDLTQVTGTGNRNRITKDDVKAHVKTRLTEPAAAGGGLPQVATVDFAKFGEIEVVELSRIRQRGADNLHRSWVNLPHVTQHDEADVTDLEAFRKSLKQEAERKGVKVTPLSFLIKACCAALSEFPEMNASLHPDGKQLVLKKYINIGMAVDTPEGLVVPVIKAANRKSIWELSAEVSDLSAKARDKKLGIDDLQGGTFSISSLGALGGTGFTPIVNAPEVAILGVAKMQTKPLWDGAEFQPRQVLPLSLSYDHRVINGADGGRFMVYLTGLLSDLRRLALE